MHDPYEEDQRRRGAVSGPQSPQSQAIIESILNQPKSNLGTKGMAAMGGFMQTAGAGGFGGGASATPGGGESAIPPPTNTNTAPMVSSMPTMPTLSTGLQSAGMSPTAARNLEVLVKMLQDRDPNKGARNMGRIAGIASHFVGG